MRIEVRRALDSLVVGDGISAHSDLTGNTGSNCHPVSAITGLQTELDGKAPTSHGNHFSGDYNDLTNKPTLGDAAAKNTGTTPGTLAAGDHTHAGGSFVGASARLTANRTTTSTALGNITDLAIAIAANETWSFEAYLTGGCSGTGGSQLSVTIPAGAAIEARVEGNAASATAYNSGRITASDGSGTTIWNANAAGRRGFVSGLVRNGANAGAIQLRFKSVTNGQTTTVNADSYITARRH